MVRKRDVIPFSEWQRDFLLDAYSHSWTICCHCKVCDSFQYNQIFGSRLLNLLRDKKFFAKSVFSLKEIQAQANTSAKYSNRHNKDSFMQALLNNILNPKTVLVYITIMPQFINLNGNVNQQLIILAFILTLLAVLWFLFLVYLIDYAKNG